MSSLEPVVRIPTYLRSSFRRTIILGVAVGVIGLVVCVLLGHALLGLFGCLGILLGAVNFLLVQRSVTNYGPNGEGDKARLLLTSIGPRLALTTVLALALAIFFKPNGIAAFGGLALFQFIVLATSALPAMRGMRQS